MFAFSYFLCDVSADTEWRGRPAIYALDLLRNSAISKAQATLYLVFLPIWKITPKWGKYLKTNGLRWNILASFLAAFSQKIPT